MLSHAVTKYVYFLIGGFRVAQGAVSRLFSSFHEASLSWNDDSITQNVEILSSIAHICQNKVRILSFS